MGLPGPRPDPRRPRGRGVSGCDERRGDLQSWRSGASGHRSSDTRARPPRRPSGVGPPSASAAAALRSPVGPRAARTLPPIRHPPPSARGGHPGRGRAGRGCRTRRGLRRCRHHLGHRAGHRCGVVLRRGCVRAPVRDRRGPPLGAGRQDAVVEDDVDARAGRQRRQALEQGDRLEAEVRGSVAPRRLEGHEDRAVRPQREPLLGDGRAQKIAAELLESIPILARDGDGAMQVEAVTPRL